MAENKQEPGILDVDVLIIGAGISGINTAQRIQTLTPWASYTIVEARGQIGGTWDLFRFPGIRSDSDLYTLGFPWYPWNLRKSIAEGEEIRNYVKAAAEKFDIHKKIQFHHRVVSANWCSKEQCWTCQIEQTSSSQDQKTTSSDAITKVIKTRFIVLGTGYFNYREPLQTEIEGLKNFKGTTIHPQFWPESFDYSNKKIAVIGSGATAVTLIPVLAEKAASVTMVQRSPGYIVTLPRGEDFFSKMIRMFLPMWLALQILRWRFLVLTYLFYQYCRAFPTSARKIIRKENSKRLPASYPVDTHFNPSYNPWDQRICICPDADFFNAIVKGKAHVVTGKIDTVTERGVTMANGEEIEADVIVTATGLQLQLFGGAVLTVDGKPLGELAQKASWRGLMLQDLPNACFVFGYTNASWTLGAEASAQFICRLLKHMRNNGIASAIPRMHDKDKNMQRVPMLNLNSTYVKRASGSLPYSGDTSPWLPKSNYLRDCMTASWCDLSESMEFTKN